VSENEGKEAVVEMAKVVVSRVEYGKKELIESDSLVTVGVME